MKALVISSGGNKSSFTIGVLKYLLGDLEKKYDIICGTSSGAIVASLLGMYKLGEEKKAATELENWWGKLTTASIYKRWKFWGPVASLWKSSYFDSTPLWYLLKKQLKLKVIQESGKIVSVGCLSLNSGKYHTFDQSHPKFIEATIASASYPGMLLPIKFASGLEGDKEELWSDGGVKNFSPCQTAIDYKCDSMDIIHTSPEKRNFIQIDAPGIISTLKTSFDASTDKIMSNDISKIEMYNMLAEAGIGSKKFIPFQIIRPENNLTMNSLDFDNKKIREMIDIGYERAKETYKDNI